jgi:hypothetical protein
MTETLQKRYSGSQSKGKTQVFNRNREQRVGWGLLSGPSKIRFFTFQPLKYKFCSHLKFLLKSAMHIVWTG